MLIKYINTKEDYCDVLEYFGIKKNFSITYL